MRLTRDILADVERRTTSQFGCTSGRVLSVILILNLLVCDAYTLRRHALRPSTTAVTSDVAVGHDHSQVDVGRVPAASLFPTERTRVNVST